MTPDRISTGLESFDTPLGGGIPAGSVVAITTPPAAPIGLLLAELVGSDDLDAVTYVTADRRPAAIRRQLSGAATDPDTDSPTSVLDRPAEQFELIDARSDGVSTFGKTVEALPDPANPTTTPKEAPGETEERAAASEAPADEPTSQATARVTADPTASSAGATIDAGAVDALVVDTLTGVLDGDPSGHWSAHFDTLVEWVHEAAGVAYLVLRLPPGRAPSAAESHVLYRADAVFEYHRGEAGGDNDRLRVAKLRDGSRPSDPIALDVSDTLDINPDRRV